MIVTFFGSSLGGLCRYLLSRWVERHAGDGFPVGTLIVNVTGALMIGIVASLPWADWGSHSLHARNFLMYGFLGGYTTVSSFTLNTLHLWQDGQPGRALVNLFGSYFLCLTAVFAGVAVVRLWWV